MEKAEITAGIKNAISRGYSLEQAKQSFLNAGYNAEDVEDSVKILTLLKPGMNVPFVNYTAQPSINPQPTQSQLQVGMKSLPVMPQIEHKKSGIKVIIVILAIILILLVGVLVASIFFKERVIEFLEQLGYSFS